MMRNHNPAKECSIRNFNQQINLKNIFFFKRVVRKEHCKTFNCPFVVYFPSPVKRVLVGGLLRKERNSWPDFFCFCLKWLKCVVFEGIIFFALLTVMPFLTVRPISLVTMSHTETELGVNSFVSSSKICSIQLNASVAVSFAIDWNVEEDLFSTYIILRSFFLHFLHKISFSSKNQNKINFILTWMVVSLSFEKFQ